MKINISDQQWLQRRANFSTLRGQSVHWIGLHLNVRRSLESRYKSLNLLRFCRNDQRKRKIKERSKERERERERERKSLLRKPLTLQNTQFGLVMQKKIYVSYLKISFMTLALTAI